MTALLELSDVSKYFGSTAIIRGVDLEVRPGERHALIGPNGAGKSTLFHLISGHYRPTRGSIRLAGREIAGLPPHRISRLGLSRSFQITSVFPRLSVFENLRIGVLARHGRRFSLFRRVDRLRAATEETDGLVALLHLGDVRNKLAGDLTYSEQRALEIGMALAPGGDPLLLDEPTAGMSRHETEYMVDLIRRVTSGRTLLVVEHDMSVVFSLCDRISVLVYGEILSSGTPDEIRSNRRVQEAYLGVAEA